MNRNIKSLLAFYFGAISNEERTLVERKLLTDAEILLNYLDLKRSLESAEIFPQKPSNSVLINLRQRVYSKRKYIIPISIGATIAAGILIMFVTFGDMKKIHNKNEILFDIRTDSSANANIL